MSNKARLSPPISSAGASKARSAARSAKIHPVVIYPFVQPGDFTDLEALYHLVARLNNDRARYARPITVMDKKTCRAPACAKALAKFRARMVEPHSDVLDAWCVDTCQMWYAGLGLAHERGRPGDIYWLIPGDFNYGSAVGREVLDRLHDLPEIVLELRQDICIGEIATDHRNSKQLIDTYGTFALLYNWFPSEGREIREYTERPRSEFFAIEHQFLGSSLVRRWYPYEQTVVLLLQAVFHKKKISRFFVGDISDLPEGGESLTSAMQQVERTERVLKNVWRDRHQPRRNWIQEYRSLETQSDRVRRTALMILENLLR